MPIAPIITFKAGLCELQGTTVKPDPTPGYIYLYSEDDLVHFCWRPRSAPLDSTDNLDLLMLPTDGSFTPYQATGVGLPLPAKKPTNGRIYVLRFESSSSRHLFWLQSRSQHPQNEPSWFSARDLKLGEIVNTLLQGEEVNVRDEMSSLPNGQDPADDDEDGDETMEDVEGLNRDATHDRSGSGGAGAGATGGDVREEGSQSREGGADGGRAAASGGLNNDAQSVIQNFLKSMGAAPGQQQQTAQGKLFTTLQDLLTPTSTVPYIDTLSDSDIDELLQFLPPQLTTLTAQAASSLSSDSDTTPTQTPSISIGQKKEILRRVLRSPQFVQSLASLTYALRDGGLPSLSEALNIPVKNGGYMRRGGVPLGGGEAVECFIDGVKDLAKRGEGAGDDQMET